MPSFFMIKLTNCFIYVSNIIKTGKEIKGYRGIPLHLNEYAGSVNLQEGWGEIHKIISKLRF
ncbi:hypothetical protein D3H55_03940 [Bacillus salacetis]|uniref:Uncharacterized protein n=1 Tax=Bacillus salacetis TaxID=2315464 RepID=A0A3A1R5R4_9BACI|nr:hypothetical protein D3H55_03940 [Bacillus salacetis]